MIKDSGDRECNKVLSSSSNPVSLFCTFYDLSIFHLHHWTFLLHLPSRWMLDSIPFPCRILSNIFPLHASFILLATFILHYRSFGINIRTVSKGVVYYPWYILILRIWKSTRPIQRKTWLVHPAQHSTIINVMPSLVLHASRVPFSVLEHLRDWKGLTINIFWDCRLIALE